MTGSSIRTHLVAAGALAAMAGCGQPPPDDVLPLSGQVEATEVRVAAEVGGRLVELAVAEGDRVATGDVVARLDTADVDLQIGRAAAERAAAAAQLRLVEAGARAEDIRQAEAQVEAARAERAAAMVEVGAAAADLERFESLLQADAGSRKQRDDAMARLDLARERARGAEQRIRAAEEVVARLRAGARREEVEAARARVAAADAQIAVLEKMRADATVVAPVGGVVTETLTDAGEMLAPRTPLLVVTDLDHAWANLFVPEPFIPRLALGEPVDVLTDAGDRLAGTVTYISPQAEFTPRNVQTVDERSKLVYRIKVTVDNRDGILKQGMPVDGELRLR